MPTVYAPQSATIAGQLVTADRLVNSPVLIQRALRTLVQQRLVGDKILTGKVDLTGSGVANIEQTEAILADKPSERVAGLMEYPLSTLTPGTSGMIATDKWALATEIADELVAHSRLDQIMRNLIKLANRIAFNFDAVVLSAVASQVTQTSAAAVTWNTPASADPFGDLMLAAATPDALNLGYNLDSAVMTPKAFARAVSAAKVTGQAPREGSGTLLVTGRMVEIAGVTLIKSTNLPAGVDVMMFDSQLLGGIAYEELGGGYQGSADDVQSKRIRLESNDGWRIQARKVAVPYVQEPGAAIKITGTNA